MVWTDIFIKRPVLALVVSLLILLIGFKAATSLPIRQYPKLSNTVVNITTVMNAHLPLPPTPVATPSRPACNRRAVPRSADRGTFDSAHCPAGRAPRQLPNRTGQRAQEDGVVTTQSPLGYPRRKCRCNRLLTAA